MLDLWPRESEREREPDGDGLAVARVLLVAVGTVEELLATAVPVEA
jgi:hypothetical protein